MDRLEYLKQELINIGIQINEKNALLLKKDKESDDNNFKMRRLERDIEDYNYNIPNSMRQKLLNSIGIGAVVLSVITFVTFIISNFLATNTLSLLLNSAILGTAIAIPTTLYNYISETRNDRFRLKKFNGADINYQINQLNTLKKQLEKEKVYIKSDILKLNEYKLKLESELRKVTSAINQSIVQSFEYLPQYQDDSYTNIRHR